MFETVTLLAGWGLVVAAVIAFVAGQPGTGTGLVVGGVVAFVVSGSSSRSRTTGDMLTVEVNRVNGLLREGRYEAARVRATKNRRFVGDAGPLAVIVQIQHTTAAAAVGDLNTATTTSRLVDENLRAVELAHGGSDDVDEFIANMRDFLHLVDSYALDPSPGPQWLVNEYFRLNETT